jgi:hypothetical protein
MISLQHPELNPIMGICFISLKFFLGEADRPERAEIKTLKKFLEDRTKWLDFSWHAQHSFI